MLFSFTRPRRRLLAAVTLTLALSTPAAGQPAREHVALGDREHAAMNVSGALRHYQEALKIDPRSYESLWKASRESMDAGEYASRQQRDSLFTAAELYARQAVEANPDGAEGHFAMARALGKRALSAPKRERVRYAAAVRQHALDALRTDPRHGGALHVMGMWHYNVMSLSGMLRLMARSSPGGRVFETASWGEAQRFMEEAVAAEPDRIVHRVDLARVLAARGNRDAAREQYERAARSPRTNANDERYQREASEELKKLR
jgi:tetratricopeptide (TPR) repeat protein